MRFVSRALPVLVLLLGCDRAPSTTPPAPAPASSAPVASIELATHRMALKPAAAYKRGEPATIELVVETKGAYHHNQEFPSRWKASEATAGVTYAQPKLERLKGDAAAFAFEPCASSSTEQCVMKVIVKFTPTQAGKVKVGGEINTGICTKETCLIEKQALAVEIDVS